MSSVLLAGYPVVLGVGGGLMAGVGATVGVAGLLRKNGRLLTPAVWVAALGVVVLGLALSSQPEPRVRGAAAQHLPSLMAGVFHACALAFLFLDYHQATTTKGWIPPALFVSSVVALAFAGAFIAPRPGQQAHLMLGRRAPLVRLSVLLAGAVCLVAFPFVLSYVDVAGVAPVTIAPLLALAGYALFSLASGLSQ